MTRQLLHLLSLKRRLRQGGFAAALFLFFFCRASAQNYDASERRNPFISLVTADGRLLKLEADSPQKSEGLTLEGIIFDKDGSSYAVINGEVVKAGDEVGGCRILKIEDARVILLKAGEPITIALEKEES